MGISNRADGAASFLERGRGLAGAGENSGDYPIVLDVCLIWRESSRCHFDGIESPIYKLKRAFVSHLFSSESREGYPSPMMDCTF